ncbi:efflux RND transporter periplasmic adaptor subunit [Opitutaceae bacterium]
MIKKFIIALSGFAIVVVSLGAIKMAQIKEMTSSIYAPPPTAITTAQVRVESWQPQIRAIGTLAPVQGVNVSADAGGPIVAIPVESGAVVKKGDLLVEIDTSVEVAQLASAQAAASLAKLQRDRSAELRQKNTISQAELDAADAQFNQAVAQVAALEATIQRKRIRAPFDGRVGIRLINVGQYVSPGQALIPLQQLDPIYVNFTVPQRQLPSLAIGQKIDVTVDAFPGAPFSGQLNAINAEVDPSTRNIAVQATLPNPQEQLRPGMFAQVEVSLNQTETVVVVPATAVAYASYGNSVFVVETMKGADGTEYLGVRQQPIRLGAARGDLVVITEGLKGGEQIASSGLFKLRNGLAVQVNNSVQPSSSAAPKPGNT